MVHNITNKKLPPHNIDAEQATLGALLLNSDYISSVVHLLKATSFYSIQNQTIYEAIIHLFNRGVRVDIISLTEELRNNNKLELAGGPSYIASLTDAVPSAANIDYYAKVVSENFTKRALLNISHQLMAESYDTSIDSRSLLESAQKNIFELTEANHAATFKTPKELIPDIVSLIEKLYKTKDAFSGVPTGFKELDQMTNGFQKSELIIIGARPSVGKTALALNMVAHAAIHEKIPCAFFSLEMSDMQIMMRLISSEAKIISDKLRTGLLKFSDFQAIQDIAGVVYEAPLYLVDMPGMKLLDLRAMARKLKSQHDIQIIFIDYITLITSENTQIPRHEQIAEISRSLKALARELQIPVVALSQVRRETEGKKPTLADLRESGSIEQDADLVMFLHRERTSSGGQQESDRNQPIETELIVAKQRNGPIGDINLLFLPHFTKFVAKAYD